MNSFLFYNKFLFVLLLGMPGTFNVYNQIKVYSVTKGTVHFMSDAPLELIEASSNGLKGLIDPKKRTFAFSIDMNSFQGFNSPLQREHFNERYLETNKYPKATYTGKIIENIDFSKEGEYSLRAKGMLTIHGVSQERIIKTKLIVKEGKIILASDFLVPLQEHNISIPKIVYQKIAEEINVDIIAEMKMP